MSVKATTARVRRAGRPFPLHLVRGRTRCYFSARVPSTPTVMFRAMRETIFRLALVAAGTLAGLVLLELALQLGALYNTRTGRRDPTTLIAGRRRILTLGDSNTYGLYVPPQAAYPRVLERLWNAHRPDDPIEVLNFAFPGMNSSR